MRRTLFAAVAILTLSGCYHATVETGVTPSPTQKVSVPWAHSFIYGLVPPSTVSTTSTCPKGVAKVETKQSFTNGLVAVLTSGIYTPMQITVTCAQ